MKKSTADGITTVALLCIYAYILFPAQTKTLLYRLNYEIKKVSESLDSLRKAKHDRLVLASEVHHVIKIMEEGSDGLADKLR